MAYVKDDIILINCDGEDRNVRDPVIGMHQLKKYNLSIKIWVMSKSYNFKYYYLLNSNLHLKNCMENKDNWGWSYFQELLIVACLTIFLGFCYFGIFWQCWSFFVPGCSDCLDIFRVHFIDSLSPCHAYIVLLAHYIFSN